MNSFKLSKMIIFVTLIMAAFTTNLSAKHHSHKVKKSKRSSFAFNLNLGAALPVTTQTVNTQYTYVQPMPVHTNYVQSTYYSPYSAPTTYTQYRSYPYPVYQEQIVVQQPAFIQHSYIQRPVVQQNYIGFSHYSSWR